MSRSISLLKEKFLAHYCPTQSAHQPTARAHDEPIAWSSQEDKAEFSLKCLLRAIKVGHTAGLLARVSYSFPEGMPVSAKQALHYANVINCLLVHSRVFVVEDIDGDHSYSLRMDTVLEGCYERENIARFLDNVSQDVDVVLKYLHHHVSTYQLMARRLPLRQSRLWSPSRQTTARLPASTVISPHVRADIPVQQLPTAS